MYQDIPALEIDSSNKIKVISYDAYLIKYMEKIKIDSLYERFDAPRK